MAHNVYICYDERDLETAKAVCDSLEGKGFDCWLKNRDAGVDNIVNEIMSAIKKSKIMILLYSKNSKNSNFVNNEVDIAFAEKRSILVFHIDESKLDGSLEFFLRNRPWIEAYPNPEDNFERLNKDAEDLVKKQTIEDRKLFNVIKEHKIPIIIGVVVILLIAGVLGYMIYSGGLGENNTSNVKSEDVKINIIDFDAKNVSKKKIDWNYAYVVEGSISPTIGGLGNIEIVVNFYDQSGELVNVTKTPFEEAPVIGSGLLLGSLATDENNIKMVDVYLVNEDNIIIAHDEAQID